MIHIDGLKILILIKQKNGSINRNDITNKFIDQCSFKDKINRKLTHIFNYEKYSCPFKRGPNYYFLKNNGLQNQAVMYVQNDLTSNPQVFIDPNTLSEDGITALKTQSFSESGKYFTYGVTQGGSDWETISVRNTETMQNLEDKLEWIKFTSISWTHDDIGFFYQKYPKPEFIDSTESGKAGSENNSNVNHKVYYHRLGTDQDQDVLIYELLNQPKWTFGTEISNDGSYLLLGIREGCSPEHKLYYAKLDNF